MAPSFLQAGGMMARWLGLVKPAALPPSAEAHISPARIASFTL
ncbi:hypothetical protein ACFOHY_15180 [Rhizobium rosettiformans]